jgi:hypothetical protein
MSFCQSNEIKRLKPIKLSEPLRATLVAIALVASNSSLLPAKAAAIAETEVGFVGQKAGQAVLIAATSSDSLSALAERTTVTETGSVSQPANLTPTSNLSGFVGQQASQVLVASSEIPAQKPTEAKPVALLVASALSVSDQAPSQTFVANQQAGQTGESNVPMQAQLIADLAIADTQAANLAPLDTAQSEISAAPTDALPGVKIAEIAQATTAETGSLKEKYLIKISPSDLQYASRLGLTQVITGMSITTPVAFGAQWRDLFVVAGLQSRTRFDDEIDGGIGFGAGFGDPFRYVGLEVVVNSFTGINNTPFSSGGFSFKVHRRLPHLTAIAVGVENAIKFGNTDSPRSVYGVVSKIFPLREDPTKPLSFLTLSVGVGSGRFGSITNLPTPPTITKVTDTDSINVFGSAALQVIQQVAFITNWNGQDLDLGFAIAPIKNIPFIVIPAVADVTGNAGSPPRFLLTVGYGFSF